MTNAEAKKYLEDYIQNPKYMHSSYVGNVVRPSIQTAVEALQIAERLEQADATKSADDYFEQNYEKCHIADWEIMYIVGYNQALSDIRGYENDNSKKY